MIKNVLELLGEIYNDNMEKLPYKIKIDGKIFIREDDSVNYFLEEDNTDLMKYLSEYNTYSYLHFPIEIVINKKKWRPEPGDEYWFVDSTGNIYGNYWVDSSIDNFRYNTGNCFRLKKEAKQHLENISTEIELRKLAEELNNGKKIDWKDLEQPKYYLVYNYNNKKIDYKISTYMKIPEVIYCFDGDFIDKAIEKIGEERLIKYLRGEF